MPEGCSSKGPILSLRLGCPSRIQHLLWLGCPNRIAANESVVQTEWEGILEFWNAVAEVRHANSVNANHPQDFG